MFYKNVTMEFKEFIETYRFDPQEDLVNEGGLGKVYHALSKNDRDVAIKVCPVQKNKSSLKKEFDLSMKLARHPNIAYYEDVHQFDIPGVGLMEYAIIPYYPEGSLNNVISTHQLNNEEKAEIITGLLSGIDFLHQSGIIHQNIKPGNILMEKASGKWVPKIINYEIESGKRDSIYNSNTSNSVASLQYASPEQILGNPVFPNTDLWSFGVILYLLYVGKAPFQAKYNKDQDAFRSELSKAITSGIIPDDIDGIPHPFKLIVKQCLVANNSVRVQSSAELLKMLGLENNIKCSCGAVILQGSLFCSMCGKPLKKNVEAAKSEPVIEKEATLNALVEKVPAEPPPFPMHKLKQKPAEPPVFVPKVKSAQKKKGNLDIVWLLVFIFAASIIFVVVQIQKSKVNTDQSVQNSTEKKSIKVDREIIESRQAGPYDGMSNYDINQMGENYYSEANYAKAKECFEIAAGNGHIEAVRNLGIYYLAYEENYKKAFEKLTQAADAGDKDAVTNLKKMYDNSQVFGYVDQESASLWYDKLFQDDSFIQ